MASERILKSGDQFYWLINDEHVPTSWYAMTVAYIKNRNYHTALALDRSVRKKLHRLLLSNFSHWWLRLLELHCTFRNLANSDLQQKSNKIGTGRYGVVYRFNQFAIKSIKHNSSKHANTPPVTGEVEVNILRHLTNNILFTYASPNIIMVFQHTVIHRTDYIVMELLDTTFWNYVHSHTRDVYTLKSLIFQVLFTLAILQKKFPGFRHNDLKIDNILLDLSPRTTSTTLYYGKHNWSIKYSSPFVKIADYDYANIPHFVHNPKVATSFSNSFGCNPSKNNIYDVHLFLNSIYQCGSNIDSQILEWIEQQLPSASMRSVESEETKFGRLVHPERHTKTIKTPLKLIRSSFFDDLSHHARTIPCWGI